MTQRVIALVSCVKQKRTTPAPACNLYTSPLFVKMRAYAERHAQCWYVLSAKHGLLHPSIVIPPYEITLDTASAQQRRDWTQHTHSQMEKAGLLSTGTCFLWLAGRKYQDTLRTLLTKHEHIDPMAGMKIGERLSWLNRQLSS